MPSFKPTKLWQAQPHTLAKIQIVQRYLYLWYLILGRTPGIDRLVYIDGFAGPGQYTNSDSSSPMAALTAANAVFEQPGSGLKDKECVFLFVEKRKDFAANLRKVISSTTWPEQFKREVQEGTFEEKVGAILKRIKEGHRRLAPTFAFVDPFGATGLPFEIISEILSYPSCEVLLNLDSDGIGRILTAQAFEKNQAHLDAIFGNRSWQSRLDPGQPLSSLSTQVLALYKERLRSIPKVRYAFAFAMNSQKGLLNYHLVFASQHPLGLEKMKEAMKAVDQSGSYSFSDDTVGQMKLPFAYNAPEIWANRMWSQLSGHSRGYDEFRDYALNETPFANPESMLEHLKKSGKVEVQWKGEPSRRGFPEDRIESILLK